MPVMPVKHWLKSRLSAFLFGAWDAVSRVEKPKSTGRGLSNLTICERSRDGGMDKSLYITPISGDLANESRRDV